MAPRPFETTIRTRHSPASSSSSTQTQIYAISTGPQKGVHMLSATPLPPAEQYLYRHPINLHKTTMTIHGTPTFRRFSTIPAAMAWIDEQDRSTELLDSMSEQLSSISLKESRFTDPIFRSLPESFRESVGEHERREDVLKGMGRRDAGRIGKRRGGMSICHLGVRRRELLCNIFDARGSGEDSVTERPEVAIVKRVVPVEKKEKTEMEVEES